jgi:hypothetical protein
MSEKRLSTAIDAGSVEAIIAIGDEETAIDADADKLRDQPAQKKHAP